MRLENTPKVEAYEPLSPTVVALCRCGHAIIGVETGEYPMSMIAPRNRSSQDRGGYGRSCQGRRSKGILMSGWMHKNQLCPTGELVG
jgi:hypothetical protein